MHFGAIKIMVCDSLPDDYWALWQGGKLKWIGPIGAPIEDVEYDMMQLQKKWLERINSITLPSDNGGSVL
jgi:hypothetical protein